MFDAGRPLLLAARRSGEVRGDLTLAQILHVVGAIARIPGDADDREPIVQTTLHAICQVKDD